MKIKNSVLGSKKAVVDVNEDWCIKGREAILHLSDTCCCKRRTIFVEEAKLAGEYTAARLYDFIEACDTMSDYYDGEPEFDSVVDLLREGFTNEERKAFWEGFDSIFPSVYKELTDRVIDIISQSRANYKELSKEYICEDYTRNALLCSSGSVVESVQTLLNYAISDTICFMFDGTIDACAMDEIYYLRVLELLSNIFIGEYIRWHYISMSDLYKELLLEQGRDIDEF